MGKYARLTLTILLFLGLGLATSVAVAWGATIHTESNTNNIFNISWEFAITEFRGFRRVPAEAMTDQDNEAKLHWVYLPRQELPSWSSVHGVPESAPSHLVETSAGWPFLCLMHTGIGTEMYDRGLNRLPRGALMGKLLLSSVDPKFNDITRLPIQPVWRNLLVNSVFWGIAWFLLFCLPCVWRLNLWLRWRPKGRCVWCGYDLRHAPEGRCPECGKVAAVRPRVFLMPGLAMPVILVVAGLFSIGAFAWIFAQQHEYDPIHWASHSGDIERVRHELDGGVNVDVMTRDGQAALSTPILLAIFNHHEEIVVMLLEAGADVSLGSQSELAIGYAVAYCNLRLFDLLIEAGADVNVSLPSGYTLLMSAALNSNVEMVRRLLEECVDVNATSTFGQSAIQTAAGSGNQEIMTMLLEAGANPQRSAANPVIGPLEMAVMNGNISIIRQLLELEVAIEYYALYSAIARDRFEALRLLIEYGGDVTLRGSRGQTLLLTAARRPNSHDPIWDLLLENGIKIDAVNVDGDTALISAVDMGRPKLVKYLLEHGADPTITDNAGNKAVDYIGNSAQDSELKVLLEEYEAKWIAEHGEAASRGQSDGQD